MSTSADQPADQLALLAEFHRHTHNLCAWAWDARSLLASSSEPDWKAVQKLFACYGDIRKWVYEHWSVLEMFELPRVEAVEWAKQGWRNWHATVVESLIHNGYHMRMGIWIGTEEDKAGEYVVYPDELDWLSEDLGDSVPAEVPFLERSRLVAWGRAREAFGAGGGLVRPVRALQSCGGWSHLDAFDLWVHLAHLRSEYAATRRMIDPASALPLGVFPVIGNGPGPRRQFYWQGKSVSFQDQPGLFRLCCALWDDKKHKPCDELKTSDVIREVWADGDGTDDRLADHVKRVRKAMEAAGLAITITLPRGGDLIWLDPLPS